jgi:hypothetical protein
MFPEKSKKNLFKAKIRGWALLVLRFFDASMNLGILKMVFDFFRPGHILFKA